jgi:transcriptional regulator with XRE-family HTH domain
MTAFGERLRRLRSRTGKTQAKVAAEISELFPSNTLTQTGLSALENRETAPREAVLRVLSEYYGVPLSYFVENTDVKEEEQKARRRRALSYIEEIRKGQVKHAHYVSAHSTRHRRKSDPTQEVLDHLSEQE